MIIRKLTRSITYAWLFLPGISSAQTLVSSSPEAVGMSSQRLEILSTTMQAYVDNEKLAGSVVLVARKNQIAYFKSFGWQNLENKVPMKDNAIFRIASQTKAITSTAIMILQEEGKLLISDPVGNYIDEFNKTTVALPIGDGQYEIVEADRPITIRDLLTHTAGIGYGYGPAKDLWENAGIQSWYFADRNEPIQKTISKMGNLPFDAQPGEEFVYGYGTDILGAIVEIVSGASLEDFIQERILAPLEMTDTHFYLPKDKSDQLTVVYSSSEDGIVRAPATGGHLSQGAYLKGPRKSFSGGAGLLSTAKDYANFLTMMLNEGTYNDKRVLSRKSVELMTVNHIGDKYPWGEGQGFGLGFVTTEDLGQRGEMGSEGEFGWGGAYHSTYWVDPKEELIVVYLTQLLPANNVDDHQKLRALVYQSLTHEN